MVEDDPIEVEMFYHYGYRGRDMIAIRAPFTMPDDSGLIGKRLCVGQDIFQVKSVLRQISGGIQQGEPIGVEIAKASDTKI